MLFLLISLALVARIAAECPNNCSGHGDCSLNDVCICYDNWGVGMGGLTGDCSERLCPYDIAFVDGPDMNDEFHKYAECSGRGLCDRNSGECMCFDGYSGQGCQRTTCPNDCSGHGTCEYIEDLTFGTHAAYGASMNGGVDTMTREDKNFNYYGWDKGKMRGCKCDATYGDVDCSKRLCPHGNDIMDSRDNLLIGQKYHVQQLKFIFQEDNCKADDKTFALWVTSDANERFTTKPISYVCSDSHKLALSIRNAIQEIPTINYGVKATAEYSGYAETSINITFTGCATTGDQNFLGVETDECSDGCTPKITGLPLKYKLGVLHSDITEHQDADFNNYECGRHGKCDYETGQCACHDGFTGRACTHQTSLS